MKSYEKPVLNTFSLSANEALCACAHDVVGDNADKSLKKGLIEMLRLLGYDVPGEEIPEHYFAKGEDCMVQVPEIDAFCKFGPGGDIIFNS